VSRRARRARAGFRSCLILSSAAWQTVPPGARAFARFGKTVPNKTVERGAQWACSPICFVETRDSKHV
jgi:hypothetical protein